MQNMSQTRKLEISARIARDTWLKAAAAKSPSAEYLRKIANAADTAWHAYVRGGLDGVTAERRALFCLDADPVVCAEVLRIERACILAG